VGYYRYLVAKKSFQRTRIVLYRSHTAITWTCSCWRC